MKLGEVLENIQMKMILDDKVISDDVYVGLVSGDHTSVNSKLKRSTGPDNINWLAGNVVCVSIKNRGKISTNST
eukprot:11283173-Ditylum_brightwellii.AAC.1